MKNRGFKVARGFEDKEINLPKRATKHAAGYDFEAATDIVIPSIWTSIVSVLVPVWSWSYDESKKKITEKDLQPDDAVIIKDKDRKKGIKPTLIPTGIKAYMEEDEVLKLYNRSSNPLKLFLSLGNGVGVIDSDYYENVDNDGHIMFQFLNFGLKDVVIKKGDRIGQGVFVQFLKANDDDVNMPPNARTGGFGSTNFVSVAADVYVVEGKN